MRALRLGARVRYEPAVFHYHYVDTDRLRLRYILRKAYKRTASTVRVETRDATAPRLPLYLLRKIAVYAFHAGTAVRAQRRRFYLVRTAAALGEAAGHLRRRPALADPGHSASQPSR